MLFRAGNLQSQNGAQMRRLRLAGAIAAAYLKSDSVRDTEALISKRLLFVSFLYALIALIVVILQAWSGADMSRAVALLALPFFAGIAVFRAVTMRSLAFPLLSLAIAYHLLAFIWPHINGQMLALFPNLSELRIETLLLAVSGLCGLSASAVSLRRVYERLGGRVRSLIERHSFDGVAEWFLFGTVLWLVQIAISAVAGDIVALQAVQRWMKSLGVMFIVAAALRSDSNQLPIRLVGIAVASYEVIVAIAVGSLATPVFLIVQLLALRFYFRRKVSLVDLTIVLAVIFGTIMLQNVKREFRLQYWSGGAQSTSVERALRFVELATDWSANSTENKDSDRMSDSLEARANNAPALLVVMEMTPGLVPYLTGETLLPLTYSWIPRFIWPEKPQERLGNEWAKPYNLLGAGDYETSYNLPWLIEWYLNFGVLGVVFGMYAAGGLLRLCEQSFFSLAAKPYSVVVGVALLSQLWWLESNISLTVGGVFIQLVATALLSYAFKVPFSVLFNSKRQ